MASKKEPEVQDMSSDEQEYLERTALLGLEYVLADFAREFQTATRRWEKIIWPAMIIFSLLAVSGFWLIYSITEDMHRMSTRMDPKMSENLGSMSRNIENMDLNISLLTDSINEMNYHISHIDGSMSLMQKDISSMSYNISSMNQSINAMTFNTGVMSEDMNRLNRNIGKPMRFMNNFIP